MRIIGDDEHGAGAVANAVENQGVRLIIPANLF